MPILSRRVPDLTPKMILQPSAELVTILPIPKFQPEMEDDFMTHILTQQTNVPRFLEHTIKNPISVKVSLNVSMERKVFSRKNIK